jgi:hypothetical protein
VATRTHVVVTDDITGAEGATTYTFQVGKEAWEIDLADPAPLYEALQPFIAAGRKVSSRRAGRVSERNTHAESSRIRAWAVENGYEISERGRVPAAVREAYEAAKGA